MQAGVIDFKKRGSVFQLSVYPIIMALSAAFTIMASLADEEWSRMKSISAVV